MKPFTFSKPKSKPAMANPKSKPAMANPKSKPAVANPKSKPAVANPKSKPATVKSMGIKSKGSNTETDNSPGNFHYLTHPRSCVDMFYDKNNVKNVISSGKFEKLKVMLEEIISEKHRILLFSQFVDMLDIVKAWLDKSGIKYEYLTGKTKDRQGAVERFNTDPTIPIFLISLKAGGTGLNLTGADYVIHSDPWWNPAVEDQATDRAYRIGQTKKVFAYRIITKNTVEEKIQKLKSIKRNLVDSVISVDRNITKSLTIDDIKEIFSVD